MADEKIILHEPVDIPEGFASEAEEGAFWDRVELADDYPKLPIPPDQDIPPGPDRDHLPAVELRALRQQTRLTQHELSGALGVSPATINRWERGRTPVAPARMVRLALERIIDRRCGNVKRTTQAEYAH